MGKANIRSHFDEAFRVLREFMAYEKNFEAIERAGVLMSAAINNGCKVISCGNGGSMSDAMHFAEELTGRFRENRRGLPAIAASDPAFLTCVANDFGYAAVFSRFVEAMGKEGDVLLAISTSGNSENVINAARAALDKNMKVVGLTGKDGGQLAKLCTVELRIPHSGYADRIQEMHIKIIHSLIDFIECSLPSNERIGE